MLPHTHTHTGPPPPRSHTQVGSGVVGFLTGFLGSMAGVGGGPFCVPLLGWVVGLGHKQCVGTSILCGLTTLTVGGLSQFLMSSGSLNISLVPITLLAVVAPGFGYVSAKMSNDISPVVLKQIFAGFLLLCSLQILWGLAYSPTGAEGHWEYSLGGASHMYEIEASEGHLLFRTQNFGGILRDLKEVGVSPPAGQQPPKTFEGGWYTLVEGLESGMASHNTANVLSNVTRGIMWVKVLDRGQTMETVFWSTKGQKKESSKEHWNLPVTAMRKKSSISQFFNGVVSSLPGNVIFHLFIAVVAGCASGLLGIAGGSVVVPLMSLTGAFPWQVITTTSLLSMIPTSLTTCYTHHLNGNVALGLAPGLVVGTIVGAFTGSKLMAITSEVVRKSACAGVLLLTACIMLYQGTKHLFASTQTTKPSVLRLGTAVVFFFSLAGLLQEKVFNLPEFSHAYMLNFVSSIFMCILAFWDLSRERLKNGEAMCTGVTSHADHEDSLSEKLSADDASSVASPAMTRKVPLSVYGGLALLGTFGVICLQKASEVLDHTTNAGLRSMKLQWVMLFRLWFIKCSKKNPSLMEWVSSGGVAVGLALFTTAEARIAEEQINWSLGILSLVAALVCDAMLYVVEEGVVFGQYRADKHELLMYYSGFNVPLSLLVLLSSGSFSTGWDYVQMDWRFTTLVLAFSFCNYIGTKYVLQLIQEYDSTMAVLCTSLRKVVTVIVSYTLYPRPVSIYHAIGLAAVVGWSYSHVYYYERGSGTPLDHGKKEKDYVTESESDGKPVEEAREHESPCVGTHNRSSSS